MAVDRSELIATLDEAREYYRVALVGEHMVTVRGQPVRVHFERKLTHLYSEEIDAQALRAARHRSTCRILAVKVSNSPPKYDHILRWLHHVASSPRP